MKLLEKLKKLNVVVASHILTSGPALDLEIYLKSKVKSLLFIGHPFGHKKETGSFYRVYEKGKKKITHKSFGVKLPIFLFYVRDVFLTLWWAAKWGKNDFFIGSDGLLAYLGLILKKLGKVDRVILYTIDFVPKRFSNPFLNYLYHFFDKECVKRCDVIWNVSDEIRKARTYIGATQITVPVGIWYKRVSKLPVFKKEKNTVVFLGTVLEKQGIQIVIRALDIVRRKIQDIMFYIIGSGPYLNNLKELTSRMKLDEYVEFLGYIESHEEVERILATSTIAVATYRPDKDSFTYFADPAKIKNYLAAGLPVILTSVPQISGILEKKKCGVICKYDADDVAKKIIDLLSNKDELIVYSKNAKNFARQFDWDRVFGKAFISSL